MMARFLALVLFAAGVTAVNAQSTVSAVFQQLGKTASTAVNGGTFSIVAPGLNRAATATLTLTYTGSSKLNFPVAPQLVGSSDFTLQPPSSLGPLSPLESATFTIIFKPTSTQPSSALVGIAYQDATGSGFFTINLNGIVPVVSVDYVPASTGTAVPLVNGATIPFGQSPVFSNTDVTILVLNRGSAPSQINSINVTGDGFQVIGLTVLPVSLAAGNELQFIIRFQPRAPGPASGTLTISYDDATLSASLSATAVTSVLTYSLVNGGATTPLVPGQTIDLGSVKVGDSNSVVVQFRNSLSLPTTISAIAVNGTGLNLTEGPILPLTLLPQDQSFVQIKFAPTGNPGPINGFLAVGSDRFPITGTVVGPLLQLSYQVGGVTSQLGSGDTASFPATAIGVSTSAQFTITNKGTGSASLFSLGLTDPTGSFVLSGLPAMPEQLAAGDTLTFTVTFTPQTSAKASATIDLNGVPVFALAGAASTDSTGSPLQYSYVLAGVSSTLTAGGTVTFPATAVTQTATAHFTISNASSNPMRVVNIGLVESQSQFQVSGLPTLPAQLAAKQSLNFDVNFVPRAPGGATSTLAIDNAKFVLSASSPAPSAIPAFQFTGASGTQQPFQQPAIGLSLASPYPLDVQGTLTISSVSDTFAQDPAVRFSTGGATVAFTIPANTLQARFPGGANQIQLQTGTVAGAILVTPAFAVNSTDLTPANPTTLRLDVPKTAAVLLSGNVTSVTNTTFNVIVVGYADTRALQTLNFTFIGDTGQTLGQASMDVSGSSRIWFASAASTAFGGEFAIGVPFTLTGSSTNLTSAVKSISVQAVNDQGASNTIKIAMP